MDDTDLSPEEIDWEIAKARNDVVAAPGQALTHLDVAARHLDRLIALGDREYTVGHEGDDALHWTTASRRTVRATFAITRDIAGTA